MIDFSNAVKYCKINPLKIDYNAYPRYKMVKIKSPMRKWRIKFTKEDKIEDIGYIYREYKYGTKENDYGYKSHYMIPKTNIMDVLSYINKNEYHIPKFNLSDKNGIKEYANQFGFDIHFEDNFIFLNDDIANWKIECKEKDNRIIGVYKLNTRYNFIDNVSEKYWRWYQDATIRNIAPTIHFCWRKDNIKRNRTVS